MAIRRLAWEWVSAADLELAFGDERRFLRVTRGVGGAWQTAEVELDADGLVERYGEIWRRALA